MAFHIPRFPMLSELAKLHGGGVLDLYTEIQLENFALDERVRDEGSSLYGQHVPLALRSEDEWTAGHEDFLWAEIYVDRTELRAPWSFRSGNQANRIGGMSTDLSIVRVESASGPCQRTGISSEQLRTWLEARERGNDTERERALNALAGFCDVWNATRDKRPQFATTWPEVEDIFEEDDPAWAEALRDRLGLGHYSPLRTDAPIEVLVMRYTVGEVLAADAGTGFCYPTVLDGGLSPFFFPSPIPASGFSLTPHGGRTLNLKPVRGADDYRFGSEILHNAIDYAPQHLSRVGVIARPVTMDIRAARNFHRDWLPALIGRDGFGDGVLRGDASGGTP